MRFFGTVVRVLSNMSEVNQSLLMSEVVEEFFKRFDALPARNLDYVQGMCTVHRILETRSLQEVIEFIKTDSEFQALEESRKDFQ